MRIAIDARVLERKMTGVGRYLSGLLNHLRDCDSKNQYILVSQIPLKNLPSGFENITTGKQNFLPEKFYSPFWTNFILPKFLVKYKIDVFFSANQLVPIKKNKGVKYISAIYDVFHRVNKSFHSKTFRTYIDIFLNLTIKRSDHIITISENSKKDIQHYFNVQPSKISVIYPAADQQFKLQNITETERTRLQKEYSLPEKFVLYVGVIENRKNINTIIKIADSISVTNSEIKFLLIGRPGYGSNQILDKIKKRNNMIFLNHISDTDLVCIYNLASVFVFPSFYEGFGLPPVEAMQSGIPVIASNTSSLKEILEDGAILYEPMDYKSFANEIRKLLSDPGYYSEWSGKGIKKAKFYDYKKSAQELVNLFTSVNKSI